MANWKKYKLGELCTEISYGYTESAKQEKIGPKFLRITDIQNDHIDWNSVPYCPINKDDYKKYKLEIGDIVIARTGNSTGATATIKDDIEAVFASYLIRFKLDKSIANPFYVDFVLRSNVWKTFIDSIKGGSAQPGANAKQLAEFELPLPDLNTQNRIASILSSLDDKIELNRRMNQTLEQIAQTLFKKYFVDDIDPEDLPQGWRWGNLGEVSFNVRNNVFHNQIQKNTIYIGLEHMPKKSLALYEVGSSEKLESNKFKFEENQILFGKLRPYFHKVVFTAFAGVCSTDILVIQPLQKDYFYFCLFHFFSEEIIEYSNQFSDGTRMPRVNWGSISKYEIAIPTIDVAKTFNENIFPLFQMIKHGINEIKVLINLRDTLLPKLMSGEIEVTNTNQPFDKLRVTKTQNDEAVFS